MEEEEEEKRNGERSQEMEIDVEIKVREEEGDTERRHNKYEIRAHNEISNDYNQYTDAIYL